MAVSFEPGGGGRVNKVTLLGKLCCLLTIRYVNVTFLYRDTAIVDYSHLPCVKSHDIEHLYAVVKERHDQTELEVTVNIQHEWLRPVLRPYQIRGVKWMLQKERYGHQNERKSKGRKQGFWCTVY